MEAFYTCRNDRAFKEVFLNPNNSDLLKALLEFILKIKIDKLEIKKTELLSGNVNIKDKRVDALVYTGNKKIEIEINSQYEALIKELDNIDKSKIDFEESSKEINTQIEEVDKSIEKASEYINSIKSVIDKKDYEINLLNQSRENSSKKIQRNITRYWYR